MHPARLGGVHNKTLKQTLPDGTPPPGNIRLIPGYSYSYAKKIHYI